MQDRIIGKEAYLANYAGGWMDVESDLHKRKEDWDPEGWPAMLFKPAKKTDRV